MMKAIRIISKLELHKYKLHLLSLDDDSKYKRFTGVASDETIAKMIERISTEFNSYKIFVIEENSTIIAAAQLYIAGPVELAISVATSHQKQGLGNELMQYIIRWCRNRAIGPVYMSCLRSNSLIKRLAEKHSAVIQTEDSESDACIEIGPLTPETVISESIHNTFSFADYVNKSVIFPPAFLFNKVWKSW